MQWRALCVTLCLGTGVVLGNYTFTRQMASKCKKHVANHGYYYDEFYNAALPTRGPEKTDVVFELHLAILAASNGHILLSSVPKPSSSDPVYEIVIGGGANTFSELRRNLRRNSKAHAKTIGILSPSDYRPFYIKIDEGGLIEFGREGDPVPVLSYLDVDPVVVKYFSFTSWDGVEALFLYDCPVANTSFSKSTPVEPNLSPSDQLRKDMLSHRLPSTAPDPVMNVQVGVKLTSVRYDAAAAIMYTDVAVVAIWTDSSGAWNPDKYNGTTTLKLRQGQIWQPMFLITNSADIGLLETKNADLMTMVNSGQVTFHFRSRISTWCADHNLDSFSKWPRDEYQCSVLLHPWNVHETIKLEVIYPNNTAMKVFSDVDTAAETGWQVVARLGVVTAEAWNKVISSANRILDNEKAVSDKYIIQVSLTRRGGSYNIVFYTLLMILVTFLLMSFWSEPLKISRIWFYAGTVVIISMGLSYVEFLVPTHTFPSILALYICVLGGTLVALLVHIVLMLPSMRVVYKSKAIQFLLTSRFFRTMFCLAALKTCHTYESINAGFLGQDDDDSGVLSAPRSNVEEMQSDSVAVGEREECAEVIDKLMFTVYSVTFVVLLACHY